MDKKSIVAFVVGGLLVGGVVWMANRPAAVAPPTEVVAEVRQVPTETASDAENAQAEADEPAHVATSAKRHTPAKPAPVKTATSKPSPVTPAPEPAKASTPAPTYTPPRFDPGPEPVANAPRRVDPDPAPAPVQKRVPNKVTINAGTSLEVRLGEKLSTGTNAVGDSFQGTLDKAVVVDGLVIAEKGAKVEGKITNLDRAGRVKGVAEMHLELTSLRTADGQTIKIATDNFVKTGEKSVKEDAAKVGIAAGIGAAIGAIAGGGKGAAIGAGAGGAAGTGAVIATRGKDAVLPVETRMTFRLSTAVTVTEKLD